MDSSFKRGISIPSYGVTKLKSVRFHQQLWMLKLRKLWPERHWQGSKDDNWWHKSKIFKVWLIDVNLIGVLKVLMPIRLMLEERSHALFPDCENYVLMWRECKKKRMLKKTCLFENWKRKRRQKSRDRFFFTEIGSAPEFKIRFLLIGTGFSKLSKTVLGSTHTVEQLSFSMLPSTLTFEFDLFLVLFFVFLGP